MLPSTAASARPRGSTARKWGIATVALLLVLAAAAVISAWRAASIATGFVSHALCSETFISHQDPDVVFDEMLRPIGAIATLQSAIAYRVDREAREVTASLGGVVATSRAVYRGPLGCILLRGDARVAPGPSPVDDRDSGSAAGASDADTVAAADPALQAAVDRAFAEPATPPYRRTKAVVVLHDGRIVAERYAPGVDATTPLLGFSVTKTVINAFVGILLREGRLSLTDPAPVPEWASPGDPRHAITVDQLLRMTSGLALDETHSAGDPTSRILFFERDMGHAAADAKTVAAPGTRWFYSSGGILILSRIIRDAVGGDARSVRAFADRELFQPLGMRRVTLEFDATGTPVGSTFMLATARDWARFGALYANDGVAGSQRILPEGWVARSATPTLDTGYGAGLWTNQASGRIPGRNSPWSLPGLPPDAFSARGLLGQFIVIVPSRRLVVVRFGVSHRPGGDIEGVGRLVADVIAALPAVQ